MSFLNEIVNKIFRSNKSESSPLTPPPAPAPAQEETKPVVDVEAVLNTLAKNQSQRLNWKSSVVDLLKLLGLDSSLEARKKFAEGLNYSGGSTNSAEMNVWLLYEVMKKLAENGGKIPEDLKH